MKHSSAQEEKTEIIWLSEQTEHEVDLKCQPIIH